MKNLVNASLLALALGGASGCAFVASNHPSLTNTTGEAWYVEGSGFAGFAFSSHVFYCPPPSGPGPVTCKEAKMVPLTDAEIAAQKPK